MALLKPFVAGMVAVLVFHQGMLALLHTLGLTERLPFVMAPAGPLGVPQVLSAAFWGGVWGVVLWPLLARRRGRPDYWVAAIALGAVFPSLVAWFVVAPLKAQPVANGWQMAALATSLLVNAAWGFGVALEMRVAERSARAG